MVKNNIGKQVSFLMLKTNHLVEPQLPFFKIDLKNFEHLYLPTIINYVKSCDLRQAKLHYQIGFKQMADYAHQFKDYQFTIQGRKPLWGVLVLKGQTILINQADNVSSISHKILQRYLYWLKQRLIILRQAVNTYDLRETVPAQVNLHYFYQTLGINTDTLLEDNYNSHVWSTTDEYYFIVRHLERIYSQLYMYHLVGLDEPEYAKLFNQLIMAKYGFKGHITNKAHRIITNQVNCEPDDIKQLFFNNYLQARNFTKAELFL